MALLECSIRAELRAAEANLRNKPMMILAAPGIGYGRNVLRFLDRRVEGRAMHATSVEMRDVTERPTAFVLVCVLFYSLTC